MIMNFRNRGTEDVYHGVDSKATRKVCPAAIWGVAFRKLDQLEHAVSLDSLRLPAGNRLEALRKDRIGQHAIRINDQYRVCFRWTGTDAEDVEIADYH